jgi:hypothetical protein
VTAPGSDAFADAPAIALGDTSDPTPNAALSTEAGEDYPANGQTAWWTLTVPADGWVGLDLDESTPSGADTTITVWVGDDVGSLVQVATQDDAFWWLSARVAFEATAGTTYRVQVDAYEDATYVLRATSLKVQTVRPVGDIGFPDRPVPDSSFHIAAAPTAVGTGPVLSDDSDTTYVELTRTVPPHPDAPTVQQAGLAMPSVPGFFALAGARVRAEVTAGSEPAPTAQAYLNLAWYSEPVTGAGWSSTLLSAAEQVGLLGWYESDEVFDRYFNNANYPDHLSDLADVSWVLQPYHGGGEEANDLTVRVYEVEIHVLVPAITATPRLRKHPIASTRKWPPENFRGTSLRKVGSYQ